MAQIGYGMSTGPVLYLTMKAEFGKATHHVQTNVMAQILALYELKDTAGQYSSEIGNNMNVARAWGQVFAENTVKIRTMTNVLGTLARIMRQLVGMYTQWTFWQIRLSSYAHMLRTANRRLADVIRRYDRHKRDVTIRLMQEEIRFSKELIKSHIDYRSELVNLRTAYNQNAMDQIRFGSNSEEAKKSSLLLEAQMYKTALAFKAEGLSMAEAVIMMGNTDTALDYATARNQDYLAVIQDVWEGEDDQAAALSVTEEHLIRKAALTNDLADTEVEYADDVAAAWDDIENAQLKVNLATQETRVMLLGFGVQIVGMGGLVLNLARDIALLSLLTGTLGGEALIAGGAFKGFGALLAGGGVTGAISGLRGALGGLITTLAGLIVPILAVLLFVFSLVAAFRAFYQNVQWFHDGVNDLLAGIAAMVETVKRALLGIGDAFDKVVGWLFGKNPGPQAEAMGETWGEAWDRGRQAGIDTDWSPMFGEAGWPQWKKDEMAAISAEWDVGRTPEYEGLRLPGIAGPGLDAFNIDIQAMSDELSEHLFGLNATAEAELAQTEALLSTSKGTEAEIAELNEAITEYMERTTGVIQITFGDVVIGGEFGIRTATPEEAAEYARYIAEMVKRELELQLATISLETGR